MCFVAALARFISWHQPATHHSAVHRMAVQAVDNTAVLLVDISEWASWATGPTARTVSLARTHLEHLRRVCVRCKHVR
jgi:aspartokinase-like uncharacterized kinase